MTQENQEDQNTYYNPKDYTKVLKEAKGWDLAEVGVNKHGCIVYEISKLGAVLMRLNGDSVDNIIHVLSCYDELFDEDKIEHIPYNRALANQAWRNFFDRAEPIDCDGGEFPI